MRRHHSWTGILFSAALAIAASPAAAQYIKEYRSSDKPEVEINLDVLNQIQEQKHHEEHDVAQEPLLYAAPAGTPPPASAPIISRPPSKRLLKPVFTARPAQQPTQPVLTQDEREMPPPIMQQEENRAPLMQPVLKPRLPMRKPHTTPASAAQKEPAQHTAATVPLHVEHKSRKPLQITNEPFDRSAHDITLFDTPSEALVTLEPPERSMPVVPTLADLTLSFTGSSSDLTAEAQRKLDAVVSRLSETLEGRLQVRGYASGEDGSQSSARRIALSRTLAVRSYLMDHGVKPTRVDVRAMGAETDRSPLDRVDLLFAK